MCHHHTAFYLHACPIIMLHYIINNTKIFHILCHCLVPFPLLLYRLTALDVLSLSVLAAVIDTDFEILYTAMSLSIVLHVCLDFKFQGIQTDNSISSLSTMDCHCIKLDHLRDDDPHACN